jgi:hypothetical protein
VRQPELLDRCKAVLSWCVLGVVCVRTLDSLEKDYAARVRHRQHDYHTSVRRPLVSDRWDDVINGCVLGIAVVRTLSSLERDYTARLRHRSPNNRAGRDPMTFSSARSIAIDSSKR